MFKTQKMRAVQNRGINLKIKMISMLMFNKVKASQKHLKNIQKWQKM